MRPYFKWQTPWKSIFRRLLILSCCRQLVDDKEGDIDVTLWRPTYVDSEASCSSCHPQWQYQSVQWRKHNYAVVRCRRGSYSHCCPSPAQCCLTNGIASHQYVPIYLKGRPVSITAGGGHNAGAAGARAGNAGAAAARAGNAGVAEAGSCDASTALA